ncbi:MAG: DUF4845 domain-containing protein [Pseudomonadota bacterium]
MTKRAALYSRAPGSYRERGLGLWGYVGILVLIGATATLGLRLGPHFLTFNAIKGILSGLSSDPVHQMDKRAIRELIEKRFKINSLYDLKVREIIRIDRTKEQTLLVLDYETRDSLLLNADVVLKFHEEFPFE